MEDPVRNVVATIVGIVVGTGVILMWLLIGALL